MQVALGFVSLVLLLALDVCAAHRYEAILLPDGGEEYTEATAINNRNQVVGVSGAAGSTFHPILWEDGVRKDLSGLTLPNGDTLINARPEAINDAGWIIGFKNSSKGPVCWILRDVNLSFVAGPAEFSIPRALNERGTIIGAAALMESDHFVSRAASLGITGALFHSATPGSFESSEAMDINESGTVLAKEYLRNSFGGTDVRTHIFPVTGSFATSMVFTNFTGQEINDAGEASGSGIFQYAGDWPALLKAGELRMLPAYPYGNGSATAINNLGQIVGYKYNQPAFLWEGGLGVPLLGLTVNANLFPANATLLSVQINDQSTILANAHADGKSRACVFRPLQRVSIPALQIFPPRETVFNNETGVPISWSLAEPRNFAALRVISFPVKTVRPADRYMTPYRGEILSHALSLESSEATIKNLPAGPNGLIFELVDKEGISWIKAPQFVFVSRAPIQIAARWRFNGDFEVALDAQPEALYVMEQSGDLVTWVPSPKVAEPAPRIYSVASEDKRLFYRFRKVADEGGPFEPPALLSVPDPEPFEQLYLNSDDVAAREQITFGSDGAAYFGTLGASARYTLVRSGPRATFFGVYTDSNNATRSFRIELDYHHYLNALLGYYSGFFRAEFETAEGVKRSSGSFMQGGSRCC